MLLKHIERCYFIVCVLSSNMSYFTFFINLKNTVFSITEMKLTENMQFLKYRNNIQIVS